MNREITSRYTSTGQFGKVLIVVDEPVLLQEISDGLAYDGFDITTLVTGSAARRALKEHFFDVIVIGAEISDISSLTLCADVRRNFGNIVIIVVVALEYNRQIVISSLKMGADDVIVKPFDVTELIARVHVHVGRVRERIRVISA